MLARVGAGDVNEARSLLMGDVGRCLYTAIDLELYGACGDDFELYAEKLPNGGMGAVMGVFGNCGHLYTAPGVVPNGVDFACLAVSLGLRRIDGCAGAVDAVARVLGSSWSRMDGVVARCSADDFLRLDCEDAVGRPSVAVAHRDEDYEAIGRLLSERYKGSQSFWRDYALKQKHHDERGEGSSFFVSAGASAVAYAGTSVCSSIAAVVNGVYVTPEQRGHGLALGLVREVCRSIVEGGREAYLYYFDLELERLYRKVGFAPYDTWSKLENTKILGRS